ncbi:MAG TPA: HAMP domain-containing sensor histidine kinase [Ktedonobacterales bacterium]|nr:HAMP domain-containing sensor histidine kinase [Ktedonobacterales bacterium]
MKNLASRQFLPLSAAEFDIYQTYERQRRQRLLGVMLPFSAILFLLTSVVFTARLFFTPLILSTSILYGVFLLMTLLFILGWLAIRRGRVGLATTDMMFTGGLGLLFIIAFQVFFLPPNASGGGGLNIYTLSEFLLLGCVIVLVGVLGNLWAVIGATLLVNALTVFIVYWAPRGPDLAFAPKTEFDSIVVAGIALEWLIAAFLIANWLTYRQTLRTLGAAYDRIAQAEQLDELKDQFITHINHELRTPIMALHGYVEYLREALPQLTDEELASALERASRTGSSLVALLSSILEVRRIDGKTDTYVPTAVPVLETLDTALTLVDPRETTRGGQDIRVALPRGVAIWGEPVRFQQILTNLLSNALKYSPPGAPIEVTGRVIALAAHGSKRQPGKTSRRYMVELRVRDYGLGIPPEQVSLLFNRFVRLPRDLASSVVGSGLGLYLCRVMTESMGGTIRVESSGIEGEGSTFVVRLPLAPIQAAPEPQPVAADQAASS